jgi:hypothetical protein
VESALSFLLEFSASDFEQAVTAIKARLVNRNKHFEAFMIFALLLKLNGSGWSRFNKLLIQLFVQKVSYLLSLISSVAESIGG